MNTYIQQAEIRPFSSCHLPSRGNVWELVSVSLTLLLDVRDCTVVGTPFCYLQVPVVASAIGSCRGRLWAVCRQCLLVAFRVCSRSTGEQGATIFSSHIPVERRALVVAVCRLTSGIWHSICISTCLGIYRCYYDYVAVWTAASAVWAALLG